MARCRPIGDDARQGETRQIMPTSIDKVTPRRFIGAAPQAPATLAPSPLRRQVRWTPALARLGQQTLRTQGEAPGSWLDSSLDLRAGLATVEVFDD
jgi:hypothetical protein